MYQILYLLFFSLILTSCSSESLEGYREEGEGITRSLLYELQKIRTKEELILSDHKLSSLFQKLARVMISAKEFSSLHPELSFPPLNSTNQKLNDQLKEELVLIYRIEGGRALMEGYQRLALESLKKVENKFMLMD